LNVLLELREVRAAYDGVTVLHGVDLSVAAGQVVGLAPLVVTRLYEQVAEIARQGVAVLIVEQFAAAVLSIADHAAVLVRGRVERQGRPDSALRAELSALYLGSST